MCSIQFGGLYRIAKEFETTIKFYEKIYGQKAQRGYEKRWAEFENFGILNRQYDIERMLDPQFKEQVSQTYLENLQNQNTLKEGVISVFGTDNIEKAYERIKELKTTFLTGIMRVNFSTGYTFFNFSDPDGYYCEMVQFT